MRLQKDELTLDQKNRAEILYNEINKGLEKYPSFRKIAENPPEVWKEITGSRGALSRPRLQKYRTYLSYLLKLETGIHFMDADDKFKDDGITSFEVFLNRAQLAVNTLNEYLNSELKEDNQLSELNKTKWAAYFVYYINESDIQINEGLIGRAIVTINGRNGEKDSVKFENTGIEGVKDFVGSYSSFMNISRGYVQFDLHASKDNPEVGRNIHIKLYCRSRAQELLIGQYTTYDKSHIQGGRILFHNITDQQNHEFVVWGILHFKQSESI